MKALWTPIDGCFQAHSRIMMTVMMQQPQFCIQLIYNSHFHFYPFFPQKVEENTLKFHSYSSLQRASADKLRAAIENSTGPNS